MFKDLKEREHPTREEMAHANLRLRLADFIAPPGRSPRERGDPPRFGPMKIHAMLKAEHEASGGKVDPIIMMMAAGAGAEEIDTILFWVVKNGVVLEGLIQDYMKDMTEDVKIPS